jgi:hypothetical protein
MRFNPSLGRASFKIFCKRLRKCSHLSRFWQSELGYALGRIQIERCGDLACCGLELLLEKSLSVEKMFETKIPRSKSISADIVRGVVIASLQSRRLVSHLLTLNRIDTYVPSIP